MASHRVRVTIAPVNRHKVLPIAVDAPPAGACEGAEVFALMVLGDSMAPEFLDGEVIVVEPGGRLSEGSYVVAEAAGELIFRQLAKEGERWLLRPLNESYGTLEIPDLGGIRGVVIQKTRPGRRRALKRYVE